MRKILLLLGLLITTLWSLGQDIPPVGVEFKPLQSVSFKYYTVDSTVWMYKGNLYGWTELMSRRDSSKFLRLDQTVPQSVVNGFPQFQGIRLDTLYNKTNTEVKGSLFWDDQNRTMSTVLADGTILQHGQEMPVPSYNNTGSSIANGIPVYVNGRHGNLPTIALAQGNSDATGMVYGLTTSDFGTIGDDRNGYVTISGVVRGVKTNYTGSGAWGTTWQVNDKLYISKTVAGQLTNIEPDEPHHSDVVGAVAIVGSIGLGAIDVNIVRHKTLEELSDVDGTALTTTGQFPVWSNENGYFDFNYNINNYVPYSVPQDAKDWTGFLNGKDITVTYNYTNRTITLDGDLSYYWRGVKKTLQTPWTSSSHSTTIGNWYLYSSDGTNFTWSNSLWDFDDVMVSFVYYTGSQQTTFGVRETHGLMPWETHEVLHRQIGTFRVSGGEPIAGTYAEATSTDAATSPGFSQALIQDEDDPSFLETWIEGTYTTMYVTSQSISSVFNTSSNGIMLAAGSYLQWNNVATGTLVTGITNRYYNVYQLMIPTTSDTDSKKYRMIMVQPQAEYTSLAAAQAEDIRGINLGVLQLSNPEYVFYTRITLYTNASYNNFGKAVIPVGGISYILGSKLGQVNVSGFNPNNHQLLSNLQWTNSGHTGGINKIAGFNNLGVATELDTVVNLASKYDAVTKVPLTRNLTINGLTQNLSSDRTWSVGTVTSIGTGLGLSGGTITSSGTVSLDTASAVVLSRQRAANTYQIKIPNGTGFLKNNGSGTWSYDNNTYLTASTGVTSVTGGAGLKQTGTNSTTLDIVSRTGTTGSVGQVAVVADSLGVVLGTTGTTAYRGDYGNSAYLGRISSFTTTGNSGAATFSSNVLNIPNYTLSGLGGVPTSRTLTINGTAQDLSANRTWSVGTVTSVGLSVPTGFEVSNSPITSSGSIGLSFSPGYSIPTTSKQTRWDNHVTNDLDTIIGNDPIKTARSITGTGIGLDSVKLVNDLTSPAPLSYYGTNAAGSKGFHLLPNAGVISYTVYNETELLAAWADAITYTGKSIIIYIGGTITLTANRTFKRTAAESKIEFQGVGTQQTIAVGNYTFTVNNLTFRNIAFTTTGQVYVTVDGHYASFYNCWWLSEEFYNSTFSLMKIAIRTTGTIVNNTGGIIVDGMRHASSTNSSINDGNIQPFIIQNTATWTSAQRLYVSILGVEALRNFDTVSRVLLEANANTVYKVTGDLSWWYHADQDFPGTGFILSQSEILKRGSIDDVRADYMPEIATASNPVVIDATSKSLRKLTGTLSGTNSGDITLAPNSGLTSTGQTLLSLGAPSTLTDATTNSVSGSSHSHAITTYTPTVTYNSSTAPITVSGGKVLGSALTVNADTISSKGLATQYDLATSVTGAISGTINHIPKFTGVNSIGNSQIYDNGTNIGVNTAAPLSLLHLKKTDLQLASDDFAESSSGYLTVEATDARLGLFSTNEGGHGSTISLAEIVSGNYIDQWSIGRLNSLANSELDISYGTDPDYAVNSLVMRLKKTGYVGIGVDPSTFFDVNGNSRTRGNHRATSINVGDTYPTTPGLISISDPNETEMFRISRPNTTAAIRINNYNGTNASFSLQTSSDLSNWNEAVSFAVNGNIGIGAIKPISKLDVRGVLSFPFVNNTDGTNIITFSESNDIPFAIKGYFAGSGSTGNKLVIGSDIVGWSSNIMAWRGDGNVGIGTATPSDKLQVNGTATATGFKNGSTTDLNTLASGTGVFKFETAAATASNLPVTAPDNANGVLTLNTSGTTYGKQVAWVDNDDLYTRKIVAGTPGSWYKIWHSGNSNLATVDWATKNLSVTGNITANKLTTNVTASTTYNDVLDIPKAFTSNVNWLRFSMTTLAAHRIGIGYNDTGHSLSIYSGSTGTSESSPGTLGFRQFTSSNVGIGTTTDNGTDKLQVNGTASGTQDATLSNQFVRYGQLGSYMQTLSLDSTATTRGISISGVGGNRISFTIGSGTGSGAPIDATYITQTANSTLTNEQALSGLSSGIVTVTNGTGVLSSITDNSTNWNTAYGWGNHDGLYRPISYVPAWSEITSKPTFATVATTGSYNDLTNKPTISSYSDVLVNSVYFTDVDFTNSGSISFVNTSGATVTANLNSTTVSPGSYTNANITIGGDGRITSASNGTSSYTLPLAANGTRGGIQIGYTSTANNFALQLSSEKAFTAIPDATASIKGIASFSSTNFDVTSGAVSVANAGITAANLANGTISGLTEVSSGLTNTDEMMLSYGGMIRKTDLSVLKDYMAIPAASGTSGLVQLSNGSGAFTSDAEFSLNGSTNALTVGSGSGNGSVTSGNFILSSDRRLKEQIERMPDLNWVDKIDFKTFRFKNDETKRTRYGVIAQEVEVISPELVFTDEDGNKSVGYIDLLIAKVARQDEIIEQLLKRIEKLENEK